MAKQQYGFPSSSLRKHDCSAVSFLEDVVAQIDVRSQLSEEESEFLRTALSLLVQWRNRILAECKVLKMSATQQLRSTKQIDKTIQAVLYKSHGKSIPSTAQSDPEDESTGEAEDIEEDGVPTMFSGTRLAKVKVNRESSVAQGKSLLSPVQAVCHYCRGKHFLINCESFRNTLSSQRLEFVKEKDLCINCYDASHRVGNCPHDPRCVRCSQKHHTKLHAGLVRLHEVGQKDTQAK